MTTLPCILAAISLGDRVNAGIDDLLATGSRLLDLPLLFLLPALALVALALAFTLARLFRRRLPVRRAAGITVAILAVLMAAVVVDRKIARVQDQLAAERAKSDADITALLAKLAAGQRIVAAAPAPAAPIPQAPSAPAAPAPPAPPPAAAATAPAPVAATTAPAAPKTRTALFADVPAVTKALAPTFGDVNIRPLLYDPATDIYQVRTNTPYSQAWLAVIDLTNPRVQLHLQANFDNKTLTSAFARATGSAVAINGEAGNSPNRNSGLGPWTGYLVIDGKTLRTEIPHNPRPFLSFDARNHAAFTPMAAADRDLPPSPRTVIWGRLDALIGGVVQTTNERNRQPRTAMAINADGTRLFLMVVDGRQPRYSNGFTRAEVGYFLKAFGAHDGMLCDEGGSSCIYLDQFGGIANVPSDFGGQERPTYTHFGVSLAP